ncbi:CAF17-like 4Fe-4S cluster assembly/insertion protein YgfZ [Tautonia sociabilis]|uniref:Aminomethyl transferase family protein n=1 Tax=Tautonia sociabilis TaxID=2080755 RepID=A0A432MMC6_9BACT|nr:glycine cleavage T C-terminal barrel domain-containing protein [Tautonia sociabilis]RUL88275.1 aminomethyl transferase family protein [Tautonia sociabilis]
MSSYPTASATAIDLGAVLADRPGRARIRVVGPDRAKFLHNLTTNDVKARAPGSGCEAFVTSPQGRTLGLVTLVIREDAILLRTEEESLGAVVPHLRKYGVLEEVELEDETAETFEFHLAGPRAGELLGAVGVATRPGEDLAHGPAEVAGRAVLVVREDPLGAEGYSLIGRKEDAQAVREALSGEGEPLGLVALSAGAWEAFRIEAGTPASGRDVTEKNLPQELARDDRAISFRKGCYLGQETVARLDALGHVNRLIRGLRIEADAPPPSGATLVDGEKQVGWIGSAAVSERTGRPIALAIVRTSHVEPGRSVAIRVEGEPDRPATVAGLPMR